MYNDPIIALRPFQVYERIRVVQILTERPHLLDLLPKIMLAISNAGPNTGVILKTSGLGGLVVKPQFNSKNVDDAYDYDHHLRERILDLDVDPMDVVLSVEIR